MEPFKQYVVRRKSDQLLWQGWHKYWHAGPDYGWTDQLGLAKIFDTDMGAKSSLTHHGYPWRDMDLEFVPVKTTLWEDEPEDVFDAEAWAKCKEEEA